MGGLVKTDFFVISNLMKESPLLAIWHSSELIKLIKLFDYGSLRKVLQPIKPLSEISSPLITQHEVLEAKQFECA